MDNCALRNFLFAGRDVLAGELLELTDAEIASLIWMAHTIEPVHERDRRHIVAVPAVTWEAAKEPEGPRGYFDRAELGTTAWPRLVA